MATKKKLLQAAAGNAGGAALNVEAVFSTYLYTGTGSNIVINNGIDLAGDGGLVWYRRRDAAENNSIEDTVRGLDKVIYTDSANAQADPSAYGLQAFNSNGFTAGLNTNGGNYVSWTFRKQAKFFDIVTYTGNGVNGRNVPHNLGVAPAMIVYKALAAVGGDGSADAWWVDHIGLNANKSLRLNTAVGEQSNSVYWTTRFDADNLNLSGNVNHNGINYVAYLFAHNNNDGEFGPDSDQDIIKCGSYDTDGNGDATVNLGFEPQFVLVKCSTASSNWYLLDTMRGMSNDNPVENARLYADTSGAESSTGGTSGIVPTSTGFFHDGYIAASQTFIYMAIRRGPLAAPDDATKVFAIDTFGSTGDGKTPAWRSGFPVDMALYKIPSGASDGKIASRLTAPKYLRTNSTIAEYTDNDFTFDYNNGWYNYTGTLATYYSYMWKRAPSYLDAVCYDGNSTNGRTVTHNLSAIPEMMWVKQRGQPEDWIVYHSALGNTKAIRLNSNIAAYTDSKWNDTTPTSTVFSLDNSNIVNGSGRTYISYLFATVANVSKVGSVTHSGSSTDVNCGFSSGARLVILKRTDATGDWYIWDSVRGIVSGNDPYLLLNTNAAEVTNTDYIDPLSSGFQISGDFTDGTYIFYAIA